MGYMSRLPNSNDAPKLTDNPYGGDELMDDIALLLNDMAKRCTTCKRVVRKKYLKERNEFNYCPDCISK
ncbi:MAG: hypothetical protein Q8L47_04495 [bacterium]|nr:hypothetical protein [bacterium]